MQHEAAKQLIWTLFHETNDACMYCGVFYIASQRKPWVHINNQSSTILDENPIQRVYIKIGLLNKIKIQFNPKGKP